MHVIKEGYKKRRNITNIPYILFIDDNPSNREEVKYFCPDIMAQDPLVIEVLLQAVMNYPKNDLEHKRLKEYPINKVYKASEITDTYIKKLKK